MSKIPQIDKALSIYDQFHCPQLADLETQIGPTGKPGYVYTLEYKEIREDIRNLKDLALRYPKPARSVKDPFTKKILKNMTLVDYLYRNEKHRPTAVDYNVFTIPKKKGGHRIIEAPSDSLKAKQSASITSLKYKLYITPFAHAFCSNRNIVTMATPHVKKPIVMCLDVSDFFPSTSYLSILAELWGMKRKSIKEKIHIAYALKDHFFDFNDGKGYRLPQGAPGSPLLSNVALHSSDWALSKYAYNLGWEYSRYADDIVVSGEGMDKAYTLKHVITKELRFKSYKVNKKKTKIKTNKQRQMVCGLVVNEKINIPRRWRKRLRAEKFQQSGTCYRKDTDGRLSFMHMVYNSEKISLSSREYYDSEKALKVLQQG